MLPRARPRCPAAARPAGGTRIQDPTGAGFALSRGSPIDFRPCEKWAVSSAGRALLSHGRGHWFEPSTAHNKSIS